MKRAEILEAFRQLSADEQEAVRTELVKESIPKEECCCTPPQKEMLTGMMKKIEGVDDPMAMCHEMMRMCCEKMEEHKSCT